MKAIKQAVILLPLMVLGACVEQYYPQGDDLFTGTLVINAQISNTPGKQSIQISRSDGLLYPEFIPESNCLVEVENEEGDRVLFSENSPGFYEGEILPSFMNYGTHYLLRVVTQEGKVYVSDYVELRHPTAINKVYYELENLPTESPFDTLQGLQFFIDFEIDQDSSEYMRWEMVETYEFRNPDYEGYIFSYDRRLKPIPDSLADRRCWITGMVNEIFTHDVANVSGSEYVRMPLHMVTNQTQRLSYGYSLLIRQHSLDQSAFRYWDELKKNSYEGGGLYDRLPSLTPSNISNENDPEEYVLGFFTVSGVSETRIFVGDIEGFSKYNVFFCLPTAEMPRLRYLLWQDLPIYLSRAEDPETGEELFGETSHKCLDCRVRKGSSGHPPDFWPTN